MYGLVALGYHMTWATSRTMNFSQGHVVMVGAVVAYGLHVAAGWPLALAAAVALAACGMFGLLVERIAVRPFFRSGSPVWLLSTIALGIIVENAVMLAFGKDARAFPSSLALKPVFVLGAGVYPQELLLPAVGLLLMGGTQLFYHRTSYGRRLKAVAWDSEAAGLMGIHVPRAVAATRMRARVAWAAIALAAAVVPLLTANTYYLYLAMTIGIFVVVCAGLNVLAGLAGQISLGHAGLYAIGAYTAALGATRLGLGVWTALPLAVAVTAAVGAGVALAALRLSGPYLAMVTIAFGIIVEGGLVEWVALT